MCPPVRMPATLLIALLLLVPLHVLPRAALAFAVSATQTLCGDGAVDPGEECDDGNIGNGDGCDSACRVESLECAADSDCDDGNECTVDQCELGSGSCSSLPVRNGALCNADAGCCQGGACLPACWGVEPPAQEQGSKIKVTCRGPEGEGWAGRGFASVETVPNAAPQFAGAAQSEEVAVTKWVRKRIRKSGKAKLKLKLNKTGRRLARKAVRQGQRGIDVRLEVQRESDQGVLEFLVQVVKKKRRSRVSDVTRPTTPGVSR